MTGKIATLAAWMDLKSMGFWARTTFLACGVCLAYVAGTHRNAAGLQRTPTPTDGTAGRAATAQDFAKLPAPPPLARQVRGAIYRDSLVEGVPDLLVDEREELLDVTEVEAAVAPSPVSAQDAVGSDPSIPESTGASSQQ
jgi:hypothetical protein